MDNILTLREEASERRRKAERQMVQEGIDLWRSKQQQLLAKKTLEQRQLREMLLNYCPWGRPGGGAPNPDGFRKRNALRLEALHCSPSESAGRSEGNLALPQDVLGTLGASGPPRSRSGRLKALRRDPLLAFQFHEREHRAVDNVLRYRRHPRDQELYRHQLDAIVMEKRRLQQEEANKAASMDQKLGWTDDNAFRVMEDQHKRVQRQHQLQQVHLRHLQNLKQDPDREQSTKDQPSQEQQTEQTTDTKNATGTQTAGESQTDGSDNSSSTKTEVELGDTLTSGRQRECPSEPQSPIEPLEPPRNGLLTATGGVELVPLLARRRRTPKLPLATTDVTRHKTVICTPNPCEVPGLQSSSDYWKDLTQQINIKKNRVEAARQDDLESCRRHFETWQLFWGRPGHGAPRDVKVKENLDTLLYHNFPPRQACQVSVR